MTVRKILVANLRDGDIYGYNSPREAKTGLELLGIDPREDWIKIFDVGFWGSPENPKQMCSYDLLSAK